MRRGVIDVTTILKASSDDLRIKIIELLDREGPKSYSGLMKALKLNPVQDAGRFAYHLKMLTRSGIVDVDRRLKNYKITELGKLCAIFIGELKSHTLRKKPLVRSSRLKIEEFNRGKIIADLIREADMPITIAKRIARDIESQIIARAPTYLTGPLIRGMIVSYLVKDPKLEDYCNHFARLGLPVYDVATLLHRSSPALTIEDITRLAGNAVLKEYALLKILDRTIADTHMIGLIHIDRIESWLKPEVVWHDVRIFFRAGLPSLTPFNSSAPKPKSFEGALCLISNLIRLSAKEVSKEEVIEHFNVFLAPFAYNLTGKQIKRALSAFLYNLSRGMRDGIRVNLGLDFYVPKRLGEMEVVIPQTRRRGVYDEYENEAREILKCLLELMFNDPLNRPVFAPSITLHLSPEAFGDRLFKKAHKLALRCGTPNFTARCEEASFASDGLKATVDWTGDWEVDTLRVGNLGTVSINLPRIAYKAHGDWSVLLESLEEATDIVLKTLEIKNKTIKGVFQKGALPILSSPAKGEMYLRVEKSLHSVQIIGLDEAVAIHTGHHVYESSDSLDLATRLVKQITGMVSKRSKKSGLRATVVKLKNWRATRRFAESNVEYYGRAESMAQGTRRTPYYTSCETVPYHVDIPWQERLRIEAKVSKFVPGGHALYLLLPDRERIVKHLLTTTKEVYDSGIHFFSYARNLSYCGLCQKTILGKRPKCPLCGSAAITNYPPKHLAELFMGESP
ncbi:TPA: hypothetical protein EYP44_05600 [Candidatus Bathyarchaeota archaeon]|nr:hypothetical protein [Candidatus Bathyarchaeota archaeon]